MIKFIVNNENIWIILINKIRLLMRVDPPIFLKISNETSNTLEHRQTAQNAQKTEKTVKTGQFRQYTLKTTVSANTVKRACFDPPLKKSQFICHFCTVKRRNFRLFFKGGVFWRKQPLLECFGGFGVFWLFSLFSLLFKCFKCFESFIIEIQYF